MKVYPNDDEAGRMLSIGEYIDGEWNDYIIYKKKSRLYPKVGSPAIVINNIETPVKTFELGFYNFGPTLATDNEIVEFFIGDSRVGAEYSALSLRSLHAGFGAQLHVRNHADTHSVLIDNHSANMTDYDVLVRKSEMMQGQAWGVVAILFAAVVWGKFKVMHFPILKFDTSFVVASK